MVEGRAGLAVEPRGAGVGAPTPASRPSSSTARSGAPMPAPGGRLGPDSGPLRPSPPPQCPRLPRACALRAALSRTQRGCVISHRSRERGNPVAVSRPGLDSHADSHGGTSPSHHVEQVDSTYERDGRQMSPSVAMNSEHPGFFDPRVLGSNPSRLTSFSRSHLSVRAFLSHVRGFDVV